MQMKPRPKKDQKTIFFSLEQFLVKTQCEISKYLLQLGPMPPYGRRT